MSKMQDEQEDARRCSRRVCDCDVGARVLMSEPIVQEICANKRENKGVRVCSHCAQGSTGME